MSAPFSSAILRSWMDGASAARFVMACSPSSFTSSTCLRSASFLFALVSLRTICIVTLGIEGDYWHVACCVTVDGAQVHAEGSIGGTGVARTHGAESGS